MVSPINYTIDVKNPFESVAQGMQLGAGLQDMQAKRDAAQQEQQRQQLIRTQSQNLMKNPNPTARDYTNLAMLLPEKEAKSMRENWEMIDKSQQSGLLNFTGQVLAAFQTGNPEIGTKMLKERAAAERNSGNEERAKGFENWASIAEINPNIAQKNMGVMVSLVPGGDKVIESVTKLGAESRSEAEAPAKLSKLQADAQKAATDAKFAESNAVIDLQKKNWDITKIQEDIKIAKLNQQVAAANAATAREGNAIKREENQLKLAELVNKRDNAVREKSAEVEGARASMDNMLNTADRILQTPVGVIGSAAGPVSSRMPTLSQSTADFEALVDTLGSQAFMAQIPNIKGMGALSNAEGEKLQAALQNFSLKQSPERLMENVKEAQRLILKGRANLSKKFGVPESIPDTPAVAPSPDETAALLKKYGG